MDNLIAKLRAYGRYLELEDSIPYWESQKPELEARIENLKWNRNQKERAMAGLENPNFFQRVFGRTEDKKEQLAAQLREISSAQMAADWDLEALNRKITAGKQELETLQGSREAYEAAKREAVLTPGQESRLMMEEISAFAPAAMEIAGRILWALEEARPWMQKDALRTAVGQDNRKMECLSNAEAAAKRLLGLLAVMPEGVATVGSYLRNPHDYIYGVTSEYGQLDRLNQAMEQVQTVRTQLRLLLGE